MLKVHATIIFHKANDDGSANVMLPCLCTTEYDKLEPFTVCCEHVVMWLTKAEKLAAAEAATAAAQTESVAAQTE